MEYALITLIVAVVIIFSLLLMFFSRYRKCPSTRSSLSTVRSERNSDGFVQKRKMYPRRCCVHLADISVVSIS